MDHEGDFIGSLVLGILLSYGVVSPIATNRENYANAEFKYLECIKSGIVAHVSGYAPVVSVVSQGWWKIGELA